jgi:hypothetical protein
VGNKTITAIVDSGADIDYVNKKWCEDMKIPYKVTGWGWVGGYKGDKEKTKLLEANIKIRVQGRFCRTRFTVLEETGDDVLVLGDPWLRDQNPDIDWKKRTLRWRAKPNTQEGTRATQLRVVDSRIFKHMEAPWKKHDEKYKASEKEKKKPEVLVTIQEDTERKKHTETEKDGSRINELDSSKEIRELETVERETHSQAYWKEINEIKNKLPEEVKEFADVFCSED